MVACATIVGIMLELSSEADVGVRGEVAVSNGAVVGVGKFKGSVVCLGPAQASNSRTEMARIATQAQGFIAYLSPKLRKQMIIGGLS